jgi:hypothetical protein
VTSLAPHDQRRRRGLKIITNDSAVVSKRCRYPALFVESPVSGSVRVHRLFPATPGPTAITSRGGWLEIAMHSFRRYPVLAVDEQLGELSTGNISSSHSIKKIPDDMDPW